jgi:cell fate regulator YaaT (PSP1 superfamily)
MAELGPLGHLNETWDPPASLDEARSRARARFKSRLEAGEQIGQCGCGDDDPVVGPHDASPAECVVGVRFRDSGRVYYFRPGSDELEVGDWVVVSTSRGEEAGQIVIAPHQVKRAILQGDPSRVLRRLDDRGAGHLESQRRADAAAVRLFGERARARRLGIKPITAASSFDGATVVLSYSIPDRERAPDAGALRDLAQDLAGELECRVELRQVGPRDEARLLGGLGRCGRTLCCSSWLPVFPEISMSMAKNQDLPLNPSKVSGVCGRLLCCLSYENDQYRQMKAVMPKLGQAIETPGGSGLVVSMHLLKELVTVRLDEDNSEATYRCDELGLGSARTTATLTATLPAPPIEVPSVSREQHVLEIIVPPIPQDTEPRTGRRRRRRRSGKRGGGAT